MARRGGVCHPVPDPGFTEKQGQYLAFIYAYTRVNARPPAEIDMQRYFNVTPPSVHQMVLTLERAGLIRRQPRAARSIEVLGRVCKGWRIGVVRPMWARWDV